MTSEQAVHFVIRAGREDAQRLALDAGALFGAAGWSVTESLLDDDRNEPDSIPHDVDTVIAFGGDGTFLEAVRIAHPRGARVGGINLGRLGYLAGFEAAEAEDLFDRVLNDPTSVTERTMVEATACLADQGNAKVFYALNEISLEKTDPGHVTRLRVAVNEVDFATYSADGIIVATPTGSTAYALSARGPIVSPNVNCLIFVPVAPHMLFDRAMVFADSDCIAFTAERDTVVTADGRNLVRMSPGDALTCRIAEHPLTVFEPERDFHQVLRRKFNLVELEC